ncbi:Indoleamine 2,3-dioxygenase [Rhodocollybia butyracea]|uniref:Indoleamine 2,3-dioxygenase n=1 Tax=Rhodocollybia butyracea TaxID=206335 RepID=A0A9P5PBQ0_9AGAR|nr:Indoleamine 2,3-dioxygenase [Rhodocollybia butyracea]
MEYLDTSHFLSLPRPSAGDFHAPIVDTTTLAAHDFDVDPRTGFMPPHPPVERLLSLEGQNYEHWEDLLTQACAADLQIADKEGGLTLEEERRSEQWRTTVRMATPHLIYNPFAQIRASTSKGSLCPRMDNAFLHPYPAHLLPRNSHSSTCNASALTSLSRIAASPVLTYSDDVLYNWGIIDTTNASSSPFGTIDPQNLRVLTTFTSTPSESHFYLTSARIELIGVRALSLMQSTLDELFVGDAIAVRRITKYLNQLGSTDVSGSTSGRGIIGEMETELNKMTVGCDPQVFYEQIRPWFRGIDSSERRWIFEGIEMDERLEEPTELSGPSAGQSSLIHALDVFLGVEQYSHSRTLTGRSSITSTPEDERPNEAIPEASSFLSRMQLYMPRHHRNFLTHLQNQNTKRSLRALVFDALASAGISPTGTASSSTSITVSSNSSLSPSSIIDTDDALNLLSAYNTAVMALKKLRDSHILIVTRYIIGPAARAKRSQQQAQQDDEFYMNAEGVAPLRGSGGTELAHFLKAVRDGTKDAVIAP